MNPSYESVRHVHAGNKFHFRWAARRCLRLLNPLTELVVVKVEGSKEADHPGECVIDVAEYYKSDGKAERIEYFQLKHSSTLPVPSLTFSTASDTLADFAKRFRSLRRQATGKKPSQIRFHIITNRKLSGELLSAVEAARANPATKSAGMTKLRRATGLKGEALRAFTQNLTLNGTEGDYRAQTLDLQTALGEFLVGFADDDKTRRIVGLVEEKGMPDSPDGKPLGEITREDVLKQFGIDRPQKLFPARPIFEKLKKTIQREQHQELLDAVTRHSTPLIIEAAGGVGKSVVARELAQSLPAGSVGLVYDCFGAGKYRNPNEPRHLASIAVTEMANELAELGLCPVMLPMNGSATEAYYDGLSIRLKEAISNLQAMQPAAMLVLFIDAADNAAVAADLAREHCFVEHLWRLPLPEGCRLVMLCRPERRFMLKAPPTVRIHELQAFSDAESLWHLRRVFPAANADDGREFRRLSSGNPRVQSVVLAVHQPNVRALLDSLGADGQTVSDQINAQLQLAIEREKELQGRPADVSAICHGLANLPPFIPLKVLAAAANVEASTIRSFVSGLGRAVWFTEDSVQFRDEPTETWFREQFSATPAQIGRYVDSLKPFATQFTYVAKAMPELLEKAGRYEEVIRLAASTDDLPTNSPIDERDVRVYRLRFAFKAALKQSRLSDAVRISFLAGEETAGSSRQLRLLNANIDLVGQLRDAHQIEQLVQSGELSGAWDGSGTVYEASLLSCVASFRPEARNRLHSARRWLGIYFDERKRKEKAGDHSQEKLENTEIIELVWAVLNLFGPKKAVRYIEGWSPKSLPFPIMSGVLRRLVDAGRFTEVTAIGIAGAGNVFIAAAVAREMMAVGRLPEKEMLRRAVNVLAKRRGRPRTESDHRTDHELLEAFICTLEAAIPAGIPRWRILRALNYYTKPTADARLSGRHTDSGRAIFMRGVALRTLLLGKPDPKPESLLLKTSRKQYPRAPDPEERKEIIEMLQAVLPWYCLRLRLIVGDAMAESTDLVTLRNAAHGGYRPHHFDRLPIERSVAHFQCLLWKNHPTLAEFDQFVLKSVNRVPRKFFLEDLFEALRAIIRAPHLAPLADPAEKACLAVIKAARDESPNSQASHFILLSRAMLHGRTNDAAAYFKDAVEIVSRFGDEVADRWQAVVALAKRASDASQLDEEITFRFLRVTELVGSASGDAQRDWDCNSTVACALRMHAGTTWATITRWRDREVSWFSYHLREAILASMRLGQISPAAAWSGSGFSECHTSGSFHAECLQAESDGSRRTQMLKRAAHDMARDKYGDDGWAKLAMAATHCGLSLDQLTTARSKAPRESTPPERLSELSDEAATQAETLEAKWMSFFSEIDLFDALSIARGLEKLKAAPPPRNIYEFWFRATKAVPPGREVDFLKTALRVEGIDYEDVGKILGHAQDNWLSRASVRREWPQILENYGRRFARSVAHSYRRVYWYGKSGLSDSTLNGMRKGMLAGLTEAAHDMHAVTFFGFVENVGPNLTSSEALDLLRFALSRFEQYLAPEFADGPYSAAMATRATAPTAYAGMVWSSLANPGGAARWEAAHAARRLVEMHCSPEVDALVKWMKDGHRGAFGAPRYPFYDLHAKLYLLIAFARAARSDTTTLRPHAAIFTGIALDELPHILLQQNAAEIALAIERQFPETISQSVVSRLLQVGQSPYPNRIDKVYGDAHAELPEPLLSEANPALEYNLGMDFESDWTSALARVFSLPYEQVTALTRATVIRTLGQPPSKEYIQDPRRDLWANEDRGTYMHGHSYPTTDDHQFYLAYHALMIAAGRILAALPAVRSANSQEDEWTDWLRSHMIKRSNGTWLSDRRDPSPEKERDWVHAKPDVHWSWAIQPPDFLDVLIHQPPVPGWIVAWGEWNDCHYFRTETMRVSSALVNPATAEALANSCRWSEPYRYYLPLFGQEGAEVRSVPPFDLLGWIAKGRDSDDARDTLDPYAKNVDYPPFIIGPTYSQLLNLERDEEMRHWWFGGTELKAALAEVWSDGIQKHRDPPRRQGERFSVSPELLRRLCLETGKHVIFSVQIGRSIERDYDSASISRSPTKSHQIFIYTPDGHLHGAKESHRIG
jgi:hypothetical protein